MMRRHRWLLLAITVLTLGTTNVAHAHVVTVGHRSQSDWAGICLTPNIHLPGMVSTDQPICLPL